ncbi:hypothetical protein JI57_03380 [Psychromonas sp. PRT-SC03]|nr:hypothetical protein JI57_03380 [Psychromonas sp. PRT-SC03]
MKKGLMAIFVVVALLLSGTYFMGEKVYKETHQFFSQQNENGISYHIINYEKGFFESNLESTVTLQVDSGASVTFVINTLIKNYPYKATLDSQIKFKSTSLNKKAEQYFSTSQWFSSEMQVSLLGRLSGDFGVVAGAYKNAQETLSNEALNLHYSLNLKDKSGMFAMDVANFKVANQLINVDVTNFSLSSHFNALSIRAPSEYAVNVQDVRVKINNGNIHIKDITFKGDSTSSKSGDKINSNNQLDMAYYQFGTDKNIYTDSEIQLNFSDIDADTLDKLNQATENSAIIEGLLIQLVQKGFNVDLKSLKSTTPWGNIAGSMHISVQKGAPLRNILTNPFVLLDYVDGNAHLNISEVFLKEPSFAFVLQLALSSQLLQKQDKQLKLEAQLKKGELVVNGKQFPL